MGKIALEKFDWSFLASFSGSSHTKCLIEDLNGLLLDRGLHVQIVLRHIQIRVPDHALDRGHVYTQRLHLRDVGVPAGMWRQLADSFDCAYIQLNQQSRKDE